MVGWSTLGKVVISTLPTIIRFVETRYAMRPKSGAEKRDVVLREVADAVSVISAPTDGRTVLRDPRVQLAIGVAIDALVALQNTIQAQEASTAAAAAATAVRPDDDDGA